MSMDTRDNRAFSSFSIINGPNKEDIFNKCLYSYDNRYTIDINFMIKIIHDDSVAFRTLDIEQIGSISYIGESGNEFIISGTCTGGNFKDRPFNARYSASLKSGIIRISTSAKN